MCVCVKKKLAMECDRKKNPTCLITGTKKKHKFNGPTLIILIEVFTQAIPNPELIYMLMS